jgi:hypothetical protein
MSPFPARLKDEKACIDRTLLHYQLPGEKGSSSSRDSQKTRDSIQARDTRGSFPPFCFSHLYTK